MTVPRLHLVTAAEVLAAPGFAARATAVLEACGPAVALHLRGHGLTGAALFGLAHELADVARGAGATLLVNDRVDVALAAGAGAHVGRRSIPVRDARRLLGGGVPLGYSAHGVEEAVAATSAGADFITFGTIWPSGSHPGEPGAGPGELERAVAAVPVPVVAIGGVDLDRAREALEVGAYGVAVLSGVWAEPDAAAAAGAYLEAMGAVP